MIDFMCHEYLKLKPKKLTLIFGRNGSGKSAILEALNLVFGGLGRERQEILRAFIRHGKQMAIARIKVRNSVVVSDNKVIVLDPRLPLDALIVIERIITEDGSVFRLNGRRVTKEKVMEMLSKANISPKNMFYFVPQERITSLVHMKPEERLDAILASFGLLKLKSAIEKLKEEIKGFESKKREIRKKISEIESRILEHKKLTSSVDAIINTLKQFYIYKLAYLYKKRRAYLENEEALRARLENLRKTLREHQEFINNLPFRLVEIDKEIQSLNDEKIKKRSMISDIEKTIVDIEARARELAEKLSNLNRKRLDVVSHIEEIFKKWGALSIDDLQRLLEDKKSRLETIEKDIENAGETRRIRELEKQLMVKKSELKEIEKMRNRYLNVFEEILNALDPNGNIAKVYNFIVRENLIDEVQGPLLLEISYRIDLDKLQQYAVAIERAFDARILRSFVVLSWRALRKILNYLRNLHGDFPYVFFYGPKKIFWQIKEHFAFALQTVPYRTVEKIESQKKKIREQIENLPEYSRSAFICFLSDIVQAPPATKAIIDYFNWKTAIVSNLDAGIDIIRNVDLDKVVTIDGEVICRYEAVDGAIYYMLPSSGEIISNPEKTLIWRAREFNIKEFRERERKLNEAIETIKEEIREIKRTIEDMEASLPVKLKNMWRERSKLKEAIVKLVSDINYIKHAYKERERLPNQIKNLEEQIEKIDGDLEKLEEQKREINKEIEKLKNKIIELENMKNMLIQEKGKRMAEIDKVNEEIVETEGRLASVRRFRDNVDFEINEIKREIKALIMIIWSTVASLNNEKRESVDDVLEKEIIEPAAKIVESLSEREIEAILSKYDKNEINNLRYNLISREERIRLLERDLKELERYKQEIAMVEKEIESSRALAEKTLKSLIENLKKKINELSQNYKYVLSKINAKGEVKIVGQSVDNIRLEITIDLHRDRPVEISKGAFSSGEKTLAIFAFIISLFLTSPSPILLLDEFDVYLDESMAKRAARILREITSDLYGIQCILTTTHRIEFMRIADSIISLVYDRKRGKSLAFEVNKKELESIAARGLKAHVF